MSGTRKKTTNRKAPANPNGDIPNVETPVDALSAATTPTAAAYVRCNFPVPRLDAATHVIEIGGAVRKPARIETDVVMSMPNRTLTAVMECAGNDRLTMKPLPPGEPWAGGAIRNTSWHVVPLHAVLAGIKAESGVREVVFRGADGGLVDSRKRPVAYERSLPLDVAMSEAYLAVGADGAALAAEHGGPVRLIVPGWYGMASVKWLSAIEYRRTPFRGHFQFDRYTFRVGDSIEPVQRMRVKSMITTPAKGSRVAGGSLTVRGWAWSGEGAITSVRVAASSKGPWVEARLEPVDGPFAWRGWSAQLDLQKRGRVTLYSAATDSGGTTQPQRIVWNDLGYGNNATRPHPILVG